MVAEKIPWIRTPLVWSPSLSRAAGCNVYLKLENLQPSGSFKSRGIGNFMLARIADLANGSDNSKPNSISESHVTTAVDRAPDLNNQAVQQAHFYCSSGGNAGLGCVYAAVTFGLPATIVVPMSTTQDMVSKLREAGARDVVQIGESWAEADAHLVDVVLRKARDHGELPVYVPPFDSPDIWEGNATIMSELAEQLTTIDKSYPTGANHHTTQSRKATQSLDLDAVICSVGGGGLLCGIMQGITACDASLIEVVAVETEGADALSQSLKPGSLVTLDGITSVATSLGARRVCEQAFEYASTSKKVSSVVMTDTQAVDACRRFADEERILVEPACGVCLAVIYESLLPSLLDTFSAESKVVVVLCGGSNISLNTMGKYVEKYCN